MKNPYTSKLTSTQLKKFDAVTIAAIPAITRARELDAGSSYRFALFLNAAGVEAPNGVFWYDMSVMRAFRRLRELGLDKGSLSPAQAKAVGGGGPGTTLRRAQLEEMLKQEGWAYRKAQAQAVVTATDIDADDPLKTVKKLVQWKPKS